MILFRSCLGCAIFILHLFCIIGYPIHDLSYKLKSNKNQLFPKEISYLEHDGTSEHNLDKLMQTISKDLSPGQKNSSTLDNMSCWINNVYFIANFNASVVKVGEPSSREDLETNKNKKSQIKTSKTSECSTSEVNPTKIRMAEYFDKAGNTGKSTFILNHSTTMQTTENNLEITYHYPSKTKV